ncbi:MAG TPA: hypothetical protein PKM88_13485, partial [bacterium]|nr:hypothetical protein [bacterium]
VQYTLDADGGGAYDATLVVAERAVALTRTMDLDDDPDTPFATQRTALMAALQRHGFARAALTATTDSSALHLAVHVPVADARQLALVDSLVTGVMGGIAVNRTLTVNQRDSVTQVFYFHRGVFLRGEAAMAVLVFVEEIADTAARAAAQSAGSPALALLEHEFAGREFAVAITTPDSQPAAVLRVPMTALFLSDPPQRLRCEAVCRALPLPDRPPVVVSPPEPPPDPAAEQAVLALARGQLREARMAIDSVADNDRREALLEQLAVAFLEQRQLTDAEAIRPQLRSPGRRLRLAGAIARYRNLALAAMAGDTPDAASEPGDDAARARACAAALAAGQYAAAPRLVRAINDAAVREPLLDAVIAELLVHDAHADAAVLCAYYATETAAVRARAVVAAARAASAERQQQLHAAAAVESYLRQHRGDWEECWSATERVVASDLRAQLQAWIAYSAATDSSASVGLEYARRISDTRSLHKANVIAAIATLQLDDTGDTAAATGILYEAGNLAAAVAMPLARYGVYAYVAHEYARCGRADNARAIVRKLLPQLVALPPPGGAGEREAQTTTLEWVALTGVQLNDDAVVRAALALVTDETRREQIRVRCTRTQAQ